MSVSYGESAIEDSTERGWWQRLGTTVVLMGAGLGWTTLWVATVVAAPLSLALNPRDSFPRDRGDDL